MLFSKKDYQYIESIRSVEIKLIEGISALPNIKGEVTLIISHSKRLENFWEFIFNNNDSDSFFEEIQKSEGINIGDLIVRNNDKLEFYIRPKSELKLEGEDKTGLYTKGKAEYIYKINSLNPNQWERKNSNSLQLGIQQEGERQAYATRSLDNPKKDSFTWAIKDSKKKKKIVLPQTWNLNEFDFETEVKFKKLIKVHYEQKNKVLKAPKPVKNEKRKTKPVILYAGVLSSLYIALSMYLNWPVPFFKDHNQAYGYSFILTGIGISSLIYKKKKAAFIALGIIAIIYSLVGFWLHWPFPYFEDENLFNYKNLMITGVILILIDLAPKLLGIPLLLFTLYGGYEVYVQTDSENWKIIQLYFWISVFVSLVISIWLIRKKSIK